MIWNMSLLDSRVNFEFGAVFSDVRVGKKHKYIRKKWCIAILSLDSRTTIKYKKL